MATPKELSIEKMKCFLKGGANGDELDEGLLEKLIEVAGNGQPSLVPLPLNKLCGCAARAKTQLPQESNLSTGQCLNQIGKRARSPTCYLTREMIR